MIMNNKKKQWNRFMCYQGTSIWSFRKIRQFVQKLLNRTNRHRYWHVTMSNLFPRKENKLKVTIVPTFILGTERQRKEMRWRKEFWIRDQWCHYLWVMSFQVSYNEKRVEFSAVAQFQYWGLRATFTGVFLQCSTHVMLVPSLRPRSKWTTNVTYIYILGLLHDRHPGSEYSTSWVSHNLLLGAKTKMEARTSLL